MIHYIYKITCLCGEYNGMYYYGLHSTDNIDDGYVGSGTNLWEYYKKYGKVLNKTYKKTILFYADNRDDLKLMEKAVIGDNYWKDPNCLNKVKGGGAIDVVWNKNQKTKIETVEKLKISHLGQEPWNKGMKNQYHTKSHTVGVEGCINIANGITNKWLDETYSNKCKESAKKLRWVTNDIETLRINVSELENYLAKGYRRGRA